MMKILLALIILGVAFAVIGLLLWLDGRREIRKENRIRKENETKAIERNPDAGFLYSQGLSPEEITLAMAQRDRLK